MPRDNRPPAFLFYVDDFVSDGVVEAMTTKEIGAYILLLCKAWREDPPGSIPADDRVLARWSRLTPDEWSECRTGVLAAFSLGTDDRWHQKRMRSEFSKLMTSMRNRSEAGRIGAESRWRKCDSHAIANATALPPVCHTSFVFISSELDSSFRNSIFEDCWNRWVKHRSEIKKPLKPTQVKAQIAMLQKIGFDAAVEMINHTIEMGWQGLRPPDKPRARVNGHVAESADDKIAKLRQRAKEAVNGTR